MTGGLSLDQKPARSLCYSRLVPQAGSAVSCRYDQTNANKFGHIRRVNAMLGLFVPALVTPLELLGGNDETEPE